MDGIIKIMQAANSASPGLLFWLLNVAWQAGILIGIIWLGLRIFRVKPAPVRFYLWLFALLGVAFLPILSPPLPHLRPLWVLERPAEMPPMELFEFQPLTSEITSEVEDYQPIPAEERVEFTPPKPIEIMPTKESPWPKIKEYWPLALTGGWISGLLFFLARLLRGHMAIRRLKRDARGICRGFRELPGSPEINGRGWNPAPTPCPERAVSKEINRLASRQQDTDKKCRGESPGSPETNSRPSLPRDKVCQLAREIAGKIGLKKKVRLLSSSDVSQPVTSGIFRPAVILPDEFIQSAGADELRPILIHEFAHIKRRDFLINLFQRLLEAVFFFHPLIWLTSRNLRLAREEICDNWVLEITGERKSYARSLAKFAEAISVRRIPATVALIHKRPEILRRIEMILDEKRKIATRLSKKAACFILLLAAFSLPLISAFPFIGEAPAAAETEEIEKTHETAIIEKAVVKDTRQPTGWKATLPNGVTVELIGVSYNPSEGEPWWKPDGSLLAEAPYETMDGTCHPNEESEAYEFALRITGIPQRAFNIRWSFSPLTMAMATATPPRKGEKLVEDVRATAATFQKSQELISLRFGVAAGPWETLAARKGAGTSIARGVPGGLILFSQPYETADQLAITVSDNLFSRQSRIVLVDVEGRIHKAKSFYDTGSADIQQITAYFDKVLLKEVKEFRFQTRPYQWVEFQNVSLTHQPAVGVSPKPQPATEKSETPEKEKSPAAAEEVEKEPESSENAATYYNKAFELMKDWPSKDTTTSARKIIKEGWREEDKELEGLLKANRRAFEEFRKGVAKERCQFIEGEITATALIAHLAKARNLARLLILEARLYERNGDLDKAIGNCLDVMKLGYDLDGERVMISALAGIALRSISRSAFEDLIASENLTPEMGKKALKRLIELESKAVPPADIIRGELAYAKSGMEKALSSALQQAKGEDKEAIEEVSHKSLLLLEEYFNLIAADIEKGDYQHMKASLEQVREELEETVRAIKKEQEPSIADAKVIPKILLLQMLPAIEHSAKKMLQGQAGARVLITSLAIRLFTMENGLHPKRLDELVPKYLENVPLDPFDLKPLRYKKHEGKWIVYSMGPDGKDDDGVKDYVHREAQTVLEDVDFKLEKKKPEKEKSPAEAPAKPELSAEKLHNLVETICKAVEESTADVYSGRGVAKVHLYHNFPVLKPRDVFDKTPLEEGKPEYIGREEREENFLVEFVFKGQSTRADRYRLVKGKRGELVRIDGDTLTQRLYYNKELAQAGIWHPRSAGFYGEIGKDFHPEALNRIDKVPFSSRMEGFLQAAETMTPTYTEDGLLCIKIEGDRSTGRDYSAILILNPEADYRIQEFTADMDMERYYRSVRYQAKWRRYDSAWYIEQLKLEREGTPKEEFKEIKPYYKWRTEIEIESFDPTAEVKDSEFTLDGLNISIGTRVADALAGVIYKYKSPPPEKPLSPEDAPTAAQAPQPRLRGDLELLKMTAMAHKDNTERIRTWQGSARIEVTREDEKGVIQEKISAIFFYDREQAATRWNTVREERSEGKGEKLVLKDLKHEENAMRKGHGFYECHVGSFVTVDGEKHNSLVIFPLSEARTRIHPYSYSFDPMWYLTNKGGDLTERLNFYYREAHNPELSPGTVERKGDLVILETRRQTGTELKTLINRYEFDLSQGGNLVRYYGESAQGTEQREWTYQQRGQVWVPASFELRIEERRGGKRSLTRTMRVNFTENTVNRPIDPSEFSLEKLGVSYGDRVSDQRMGIAYYYGGDEAFEVRDDALVKEKLQQRITFDFTDIPFCDVIEVLRTTGDLNFVIDSSVVTPQDLFTPITLRLTDVPIESALKHILAQMGLKYVINDGAVFISDKLGVMEEATLAIYDVRDVIAVIEDYEAPKLGILEPGEEKRPLWLTEEERKKKAEEAGKELEKLILEEIDPEVWLIEGNSIRYRNGQLIVMAPGPTHRKILKLRDNLRKERALQVMMRIKFISAAPQFLEKIKRELDLKLTPIAGVVFMPSGDIPIPVGAGEMGYLKVDDVKALLERVQKSDEARIMSALRLTLFNSQRGYVAITHEMYPYISDIQPAKGTGKPAEGELVELETATPVLRWVRPGLVFDVRPKVSEDRKYVWMDNMYVGLAQIIGFKKKKAETGQIIEVPEVQISGTGRFKVSIPDGETLLITGLKMPAKEGEYEEEVALTELLLLITPHIIIQEEAEERVLKPGK